MTQVSFRYLGSSRTKWTFCYTSMQCFPFPRDSTCFKLFCAFCSWFGGFFHLKCQLWYHTRTCLRALQLPLKSCHGGPKFQTAGNSTNRTWSRTLRRALWCPLTVSFGTFCKHCNTTLPMQWLCNFLSSSYGSSMFYHVFYAWPYATTQTLGLCLTTLRGRIFHHLPTVVYGRMVFKSVKLTKTKVNLQHPCSCFVALLSLLLSQLDRHQNIELKLSAVKT